VADVIHSALGDVIRRLRAETSLTPADLAKLVDVHPRIIVDLEEGRWSPSPDLLARIRNALEAQGARCDGLTGFAQTLSEQQQDDVRTQLLKKWSTAFAKVGGPLSVVACILLVIKYQPSPGHFLPMTWNVGIVLVTVVCLGASYGLGALFGYVIWLVKNRREP
jgi:transcriptional regulator with XRE-family HTH domain